MTAVCSCELKIALIPLEINWEEIESNISRVEKILATVHPETDLVILPETFSTGFPSGERKEFVGGYAESMTGRTMLFIHKMAKRYNFAIAGSFIAQEGKEIYNRAFFIEPSGDEYFYDKHHLFTMAKENEIFSCGNNRLILRYRGWNISMIICYDIRFPVWCRNIRNEYDLLIAVANWPVARVDAWKKLLYARAIENQSYVCGVNCCGIDKNGFEYDGSSAIIDFKGKDISVDITEDRVLYANLKKELLDSFRKKFPAWNDSDDFQFVSR